MFIISIGPELIPEHIYIKGYKRVKKSLFSIAEYIYSWIDFRIHIYPKECYMYIYICC